MTHLTKQQWADALACNTGKDGQGPHALEDLAELFARVEALETELSIAKIYADKRSQELAGVYGQLARRDEENAALSKDNAKMRAMLAGNKEPDNG
jgi:hypothetical protein